MQFRKLAAVAGSAIIAGMTIASPALAAVTNVPDWTKLADGTKFPMFVIGETAKTSDVAGALDMAVRLAGESKTTSTTVTSSTVESVTNGAKIETSGSKLSPNMIMQSVKSILTENDLTILKTGSFSPNGLSAVPYKQYLYIGGEVTQTILANTPHIEYSKPTGENTPRLSLKMPNGFNVYTYKLTFSTPVSLTTVTGATPQTPLTSLLAGTTLNIMGSDFVVTAATYGTAGVPISDMTLVGGKNIIEVNTGEVKELTDGAHAYKVSLTGIGTGSDGGTTYFVAIGTLTVDGTAYDFSVRAGQTTDIGGTKLAAVKVYTVGTAGAGHAKMVLGASEVKLTTAGSITKANQIVTGLTSTFTQSAAALNGISITYAPNEDKFLKVGDSFPDAFAGTFDLKFQSFAPDFSDTVNRQAITFTPSSYNMQMVYRNADNNDETVYTMFYDTGHPLVPYRWAKGTVTASGTNNTFQDLVFDESQSISFIDGDYFVISYGGFSHVMRAVSADFANSQMTFADEKGNNINVFNTTPTAGTLIVDGNSFNIAITNGNSIGKVVQIDLNRDGTIGSTPGQQYSNLVPSKISSGQGGIYFYGKNSAGMLNMANTTTVVAIDGADAYANIGLIPIRIYNSDVTSVEIGGTNYTLSTTTGTLIPGSAATGYMDFAVLNTTTSFTVGLTTKASGVPTYNDILYKPGMVLVEEAQQGGTTHNWVYLPMVYDGTNVRLYFDSPASDDANFVNNAVVGGATGESYGMTTYGTLVHLNVGSTASGTATLSYPDTFANAGVYILGPSGAITTGVMGGGEAVVKVTSDIVKLDNEVTDADKTAYDMVLMGGPCVNKLVAALATAGKFAYTCTGWPGEDFGMAKVIQDGFATGKVAFVVAGTRAADTDNLARMLQAGSITTAAPAVKVVTATQQVSMAA